MLKSVNLSHPFIDALHKAIKTEYDCCLCDIIGPHDIDPKFMAVFILKHFYEYKDRPICVAYNTAYPFVETINKRQQELYIACEPFRDKVHRILNFIEEYEKV